MSLKDYKIDYLIGTGKTALVYLALDSAQKEVALKIPRDDVRNDPEQSGRFASEVNLSVKLDHPHIVKAYGGIATGPDAYLCLEYFQESSLDQRLARNGRTDQVTALRYATQLASALAYIHGQNIVHQDVKAANVFIKNGNVYLGDFGVAIRTGVHQNVVAGSPFYMAPEIYQGKPSSSASDVYSLCILIYELLYGNRPFDGDSYEALMVAHLTQYPKSLSTRCPDLPKSTLRDLDRGLSKKSEERPSASELYHSLLKALTRLGGQEYYVPPPELLDWDDEVPIQRPMDTLIEEPQPKTDAFPGEVSSNGAPILGRHGPPKQPNPPPFKPEASNQTPEKKGFLGGLFGRKK
ncbi:MAG: serine/threonine-protein kinase [Deinococcaceae bacterium]